MLSAKSLNGSFPNGAQKALYASLETRLTSDTLRAFFKKSKSLSILRQFPEGTSQSIHVPTWIHASTNARARRVGGTNGPHTITDHDW
jgi:hypothetical protein